MVDGVPWAHNEDIFAQMILKFTRHKVAERLTRMLHVFGNMPWWTMNNGGVESGAFKAWPQFLIESSSVAHPPKCPLPFLKVRTTVGYNAQRFFDGCVERLRDAE